MIKIPKSTVADLQNVFKEDAPKIISEFQKFLNAAWESDIDDEFIDILSDAFVNGFMSGHQTAYEEVKRQLDEDNTSDEDMGEVVDENITRH